MAISPAIPPPAQWGAPLPDLEIVYSSASASAPLNPLGSGLISAAVHLSCVLVLALCTSSQRPTATLGWLQVTGTTAAGAIAELPELTFQTSSPEAVEQIDVASLTSPLLPSEIRVPAETAEFDLAAAGEPAANGPLKTVSALVPQLTSKEVTSPQGGAEFYGIQSTGERFVYVVDCSSSMEGNKWYAARQELIASLRRLGSSRSFFVILFDGSAHAMYGLADLQRGMVPATEENIEKCEAWMDAHTLGNATSPYAAVRQALTLQPDAVFLLTDGEFIDPTAEYLRSNNVRRVKGKRTPEVVVHTVGFYTRKSQGLLQRIARDNGGIYQFVAKHRP